MATAKRTIVLDVTTAPGARQAVKELNQRLRSIETNSERSARSLKKMGSSISFMSVAAKAFIALNFAKRIAGFSDSLTLVNARLKLVTDGTEELTKVSEELFKVADRSRTSYVATGELYARLALATQAMNISSQELLNTTEGLSNAILLSGASAQEAKALLIQVSQAMAKGKLDGDEFRSVMENGSYAADLLARSLGVTRGELFALSKAGQITTDVMLKAWGGAVDETQAKVNQMPITFGQAFTKIENSFAKLLQSMAPMINELAGWLASLADTLTSTVGKIQGAAEYIAKLSGNGIATSRADQLLAEERAILNEIRELNADWDELEARQALFPNLEVGAKVLRQQFLEIADNLLGARTALKALRSQQAGLGGAPKIIAPTDPVAAPAAAATGGTKAPKEVLTWQEKFLENVISQQTEVDRLAEKVNLLDEAFFSGAISEDVWAQELERITGRLGENADALDKAKDKAVEFSEAMNIAIAGSVVDSIGNMTDAFVDFAITGKQSFQELTASILSDISKMILKFVVLNALKSALSGFEGQNNIGGAFYKIIAGSFATGTPYVPQDGLAYLHKGERVVPAIQNTNSTTNNYGGDKPVSIINVTDPSQIAEVMSGSVGEEIIINQLRRNPDLVRQVIA